MEGYDPSTYGERFADVYDDWYGEVSDVAGTVDRIAALAKGGPALELGVGSGRIAIPLAARGVEVHGVDTSPAMLARLHSKPGGAAVHTTVADMATLDLGEPPPFSVVFVAFNTFFNLTTAAAQQACLERVAALLAPGGSFVLEAFVPAEGAVGGAVEPRRIAADEVVLTVSTIDTASQTVSGQHVHLSEAGIRLRPWCLRFAPPEELDEMAGAAGLELVERQAGWRDEPFGPDSPAHVSTYRCVRVNDRAAR
jgi:SAM-dependent methyltransferase